MNARDLHAFLEAKKDFSDWIKERIRKYEFVEGVDFIKFPHLGESTSKPLIEYHLTLDMAKELSMVERNAKGKGYGLLMSPSLGRAVVTPPAKVISRH